MYTNSEVFLELYYIFEIYFFQIHMKFILFYTYHYLQNCS